MIRSLLLKLGMLALTVAVVVWVGWLKRSEEPRTSQETPAEEVGAEAPSLPSAPSASSAVRTPTVAKSGPNCGGVARSGAPSAGRPQAKLDLNHATAADFERLPGIGPVLAKSLWEDRERHGPFRTVEDLKRVKGIGAKRLELVRPLVMVHAGETTERKPQ
jgi:competence protein ComEA